MTSYTYEPSSNRLIEIDFDSVGVDANGNTTALHGMNFGYTSDNRLSTVDGLGFARYNGLGQRVMKETLIPGNTFWRRAKVYVYGKDGELLAETGPKGQVTRNYVYLNGRLIALVDRIPSSSELFLRADFDNDGMISARDYAEWWFHHSGDPGYDVTGDGVNDGADDQFLVDCVNQGDCVASDYEHRVYTVHTDRLGTPYMLKDESATSVWQARYDPFGMAEVDEDPDGDGNSVTLNVRFPGQYYDDETGLHYNYFRDYDPSTGRYIQSDPIGLAGGINTYAYVRGNPLKYSDPLGLCPLCAIPAIGIGWAASEAWQNSGSPESIPDPFQNIETGPWPGSTTRDDAGKAGEEAAEEIEDENGACDLNDPEACKETARKCKRKCVNKALQGHGGRMDEWILRCHQSCTSALGCGNFFP